ncbi:noscapine synthase SDR1-like [Tasmannia lanceolata]|uniref:noscapine synthase SDR1-like n=1 Tax=Tasmannia lanceolata TaxID=3420 RepID=UPI004063D3F1
MEGEKKGVVCVTGGAGHLASWLIMRLLQHGYSVRTTVRSDPNFNEDTSHLKILPGASENLEICNADLSVPNSFDAIIDGCIGVFHVAHPTNVFVDSTESQDSVIKIAVDGTLGILKACSNSKTVKRIIYTSSVAALMFNKSNEDLQQVDENVWTDLEFCRTHYGHGSTYFISKTLTEKAALEFAEERGLDLVTLLPSMVVGPFLIPYFPLSFYTALALIRGDRDQCNLLKKTPLVHIDDVASAQIFLFECPEAKGRYICSSLSIPIRGLAKFLSTRYPEFEIPPDLLREVEEDEEEPIRLSSEKLLNLGFKFKYGLEETYDGAIKCCKEKGFMQLS